MPQPVAAVTSASRRKNRADTATPFFLIRALFGPARQPLPCPAAGRLFWAVVAHCLEFEQRGPLRHWSESASVDALEPLSSRNSVTTGRLAETENRRSRQDGAVAPRAAASDCRRRVVGAYASVVGCRSVSGRATYGGRRPCTTLRRR